MSIQNENKECLISNTGINQEIVASSSSLALMAVSMAP
jgi:hypothetical protein